MARTVPDWAKRKQAGLKHGFRSGLEETAAKTIKDHGEPVLFEVFKVPYVIPQSLHTYTPDFLLSNGIIVETKGIFDATDRAKHLLLKAQHPGLDIRFVFTRSKAPIGPGAKTTMAEWCQKHGYLYADKVIPPSWFKEPGPGADPRDYVKGLKPNGTR